MVLLIRAFASRRVFVFCRSADTSLEEFPLPNVSQFVDVRLPPASQQRVRQRDSDTVLPRNKLYYQYAQHHKSPQAPYVDRSERYMLKYVRMRSDDFRIKTHRMAGALDRRIFCSLG